MCFAGMVGRIEGRVMGEIVRLRHLQINPSGLPTEVVVPLSKRLLWRIGCGVDDAAACWALEGNWGAAHDIALMWRCVASMTDHKLKGAQLQRLYGIMKQAGYREGPPLAPAAEDLPAAGGCLR
jgi:hypothetical protein